MGGQGSLLGDLDGTDLTELLLGELSLDCVQGRFLLLLDDQLTKLLGTGTDLLLGVLRALGDLVIPDVGKLEDLSSEVDGGGGQMAGGVLDQSVLDLGQFDEVAGHHVGLVVAVQELGVSLEEQVGTGEGDVEVQLLEHLSLHLENLLLGVSFVSHVDEISQIRWVDLLILAGGEKRGDSNQLKLLSADLSFLKIAVNEVHCQEQGLVDKLELEMDVDQPVDENRAHFLIDVGLLGHVTGLGKETSLVGSEALEDLFGVRSDLFWDMAISVVDVVHVVDGPKINCVALDNLSAVVLKDWLGEDVPLFGSIASLGLQYIVADIRPKGPVGERRFGRVAVTLREDVFFLVVLRGVISRLEKGYVLMSGVLSVHFIMLASSCVYEFLLKNYR